VGLHLVMKAPVWHLISRIDVAGGSSSYHRYQLVDACIRHFSDWWLIGVKSTAEWGWDMWDTANQYVSTADGSGLIPFLLLIATIVYGFKYLGRARTQLANDKRSALFVWAMGSALFANVVAFFGISYFDQTIVVWYGLLAAISTVAWSAQMAKAVQPEPVLDSVALDQLEAGLEDFSLSKQVLTAESHELLVARVREAMQQAEL
jgi:hypothetical protein